MTTALRTRSLARRRTTAATVALLLGFSLTACGGGDDDPSDPGSSDSSAAPSSDSPSDSSGDDASDSAAGDVPTEEELASALLTTTDLPEGFTVGTEEEDEGEDQDPFEGTCLADIGEFSESLGSEPDAEAEVELVAESESGQTSVNGEVQAYADPSTLAPTFSTFTDELQTCTSVETTDDDGVRYDLDIAYDDSVDLPDADDQLRIAVTGTISSGAESYELTYRFVIGLLGRFMSIVGTFAIGQDATGALDATDDLAALQAGRVGELG